MNPELLVCAYAVFGLIIGSFLNVCIYRIPLGKSVVFPGSGCPHCGQSIRFYDNIPVLSYLLLRGKCRFCKEPISHSISDRRIAYCSRVLRLRQDLEL